MITSIYIPPCTDGQVSCKLSICQLMDQIFFNFSNMSRIKIHVRRCKPMAYLTFDMLKADIISISIACVLLCNDTFSSSWSVVLTTKA